MGGSSGLIVHVALHIARRIDDPEACIVTILPDTGERYLSKLYSDEWMRENQLLDADRTTLASVLSSKLPTDHPVVSVAPGTTVRQALRLMSLHDVSQLPIMESGNCVGSVSDWSLSAKSLADSLVATGFPSRKRHLNVNIHFYHQMAMATHGVRRGGSAAIDLAYVACGGLDAFWEFGLNPWDMAAGTLLVAEAGGRCSARRRSEARPR